MKIWDHEDVNRKRLFEEKAVYKKHNMNTVAQHIAHLPPRLEIYSRLQHKRKLPLPTLDLIHLLDTRPTSRSPHASIISI